MLKRRLEAIETALTKAGGSTCPACWSRDGRWSWVPFVPALVDDPTPFDRDGRCTTCGAVARTTIDLVTTATIGDNASS